MSSDLELFVCDRHQSLRLTPGACASSWKFAKTLPADSSLSATKCKGCHVGARNAGERVEESLEVDQLDKLCARCGRGAKKMVYGKICVSCANRQYEFIKGKNARGNRPTGIPYLVSRAARLMLTAPRQLELEYVACGAEAWLSMMREAKADAYLAFDGLARRGYYL